MAERIAIEIVIEVWMSIDMDDGQIIVMLAKRLKYWIGDRMVTSERYDLASCLELGLNRRGDRCSIGRRASFVRYGHIANIVDLTEHIYR